jgi:predicted nucleic acid-binding protein
MATLADAGALVALLDRRQDSHGEVVAATKALTGELVTTCAAFTEAMYLVGKVLGLPGQERLWGLRSRGTLEIAELPSWDRSTELMHQYRDAPMALADATLVAIAEARGVDSILTLDSHFLAYRFRQGRTLRRFRVLPSASAAS